jgi:hypothetical protein
MEHFDEIRVLGTALHIKKLAQFEVIEEKNKFILKGWQNLKLDGIGLQRKISDNAKRCIWKLPFWSLKNPDLYGNGPVTSCHDITIVIHIGEWDCREGGHLRLASG